MIEAFKAKHHACVFRRYSLAWSGFGAQTSTTDRARCPDNQLSTNRFQRRQTNLRAGQLSKMARLSQDSDSDDFPDLADLVLRPKVPLASTSANDRASKIPNPRSTSITTIARRLEVQDGHLPGSHNSLERKSRSPRKTQEREATIIDHTGSAERPTARRQRTLLAELKEALSSSEEDSDAFISL